MTKVAVLIGSESDHDIIKGALDVLEEFGVPFALEVTSAHRSPERTLRLVKDFEQAGVRVFITAAGKAAHLAGVVASHTLCPVIGVPIESGGLGGLDALLSTVQMPKGVPVATVAVGKTGAANAALLAVEILGLEDKALRSKLIAFREEQAANVEEASRKLKNRG